MTYDALIRHYDAAEPSDSSGCPITELHNMALEMTRRPGFQWPMEREDPLGAARAALVSFAITAVLAAIGYLGYFLVRCFA